MLQFLKKMRFFKEKTNFFLFIYELLFIFGWYSSIKKAHLYDGLFFESI